MFAPSYLRIRRPINKFGKILFQAVEILMIRRGLKNWGYAALHLFLVPVRSLPITANRSTCRTRMWLLSNSSEAAWMICIFLFDELTVWFSDTWRAWSQTLLLPETHTRCSHLIPSWKLGKYLMASSSIALSWAPESLDLDLTVEAFNYRTFSSKKTWAAAKLWWTVGQARQ